MRQQFEAQAARKSTEQQREEQVLAHEAAERLREGWGEDQNYEGVQRLDELVVIASHMAFQATALELQQRLSGVPTSQLDPGDLESLLAQVLTLQGGLDG